MTTRGGGVRTLAAHVDLKGATMAAPTDATPVLDLLARMTRDSLETSTLDPQTLMLVRIAALAALDGPPISYEMTLEAATDVGIDADRIRGVLTGIAPVIGVPRVVASMGKIADALEIDIDAALSEG
jgi:alkylhydroperoxidase/carboxymuconolactone decarboxylase family protein YurZ